MHAQGWSAEHAQVHSVQALLPSLPSCSNNLSDLPDDFDQLRYLRTLRMKYNQIKRIPAVITRLPQVWRGKT